MPILLKDMKVGMHDKVAEQVVDSFIRHSEVLELLPFDNAVSPSGGSTLTYGYVQTKLPSNTAFRALNTEYTSSEAKLEQKAVNLKVFGGAFEIDRVIKDAEGMYDNMAYQIDEKVISAIGTFHNAMINGDSAANSETFDGLDKFLVGQTTEFNAGAEVVAGRDTLMKMINQASNNRADEILEALHRIIALLSDEDRMHDIIVKALNDGSFAVMLDGREVGRIVRKYA